MILTKFRAGDRVMVTAKDEFYAYIDGWRGIVVSRGPSDPDGHHRVSVKDEGMTKLFIVPADQLAFCMESVS